MGCEHTLMELVRISEASFRNSFIYSLVWFQTGDVIVQCIICLTIPNASKVLWFIEDFLRNLCRDLRITMVNARCVCKSLIHTTLIQKRNSFEWFILRNPSEIPLHSLWHKLKDVLMTQRRENHYNKYATWHEKISFLSLVDTKVHSLIMKLAKC